MRALAVSALVVGCVGLLGNAFVAAAVFAQMRKQGTGRGAVASASEPWLLLAGVEAAVSVALACLTMLAGGITLRRPRLGVIPLQWLAWAKLPFALVFGMWAGWAMTVFVSREWLDVAAGALAALLVSAGYPLYVLRALARSRRTASMIDPAGGVHA